MDEDKSKGRGTDKNRPSFLDEGEAFDRRMQEILEDVEEPVKGKTIVFRGTGVPAVWVKRYFHSEEGVEGFLRDFPEVPADWVDDYMWIEAASGEPPPDAKIEIVRLPEGQGERMYASGKLDLIASQTSDLPEIERNMDEWSEEARLAFPGEWREHMRDLGRIVKRLRSGDLDGREVVTAHRRAAAEIEDKLPVIGRLGLEEPPAELFRREEEGRE